MTNDTPPPRRPRWAIPVLCTGTAALLLGAGILIGRLTVPDPVVADPCEASQAAFSKYSDEAGRMAKGSQEETDALILGANVVLQSPQCFKPETRALVQAFKDRQD